MMKTAIRIFLLSGAFLAALAVASGAFGAHLLQDLVSSERLQTFETGTRYLMIHSIGLLVIGLLNLLFQERLLETAGWLILVGAIIFSGSLAILVIFDIPMMGAITPLGGISLIAGWVTLGIACTRVRLSPERP